VPIAEIAVEESRAWLRSNLHALDADRHVVIHSLIQPGSADLSALFSRRSEADIPLANDTSIGVGYAPMSPLERLVLAVEKHINARNGDRVHPAWGEDVKVMGVGTGTTVRLSIACAMIGRHISNVEEYFADKSSIAGLARDLAAQSGFGCGCACSAPKSSRQASSRQKMLITNANEKCRTLQPSDFDGWLAGNAGGELLKPAANEYLQAWPVSRRVSSSQAPGDDSTPIDHIAP
ncbi:MAG: methionine adenosyltransferase, partial [Sphingobacteriales bacterium]